MSQITISDKSKCKHYNVGYCKFKDGCKFEHPKEDCQSQKCSIKNCPKRHRRSCKFGLKCKRSETCEFVHTDQDNNSDISILKTQVDSLKNTVAEMSDKISNLEKEIKLLQTPTSVAVTSNEVLDSFNCDECGYSCKREISLRKHMNTKHHLESKEVDKAVKNNSNEKELKEARFKIKELEDKVEHITLSKSRVECEVNKLRVESDSLANLLSLRQNIDNPVPPSKSSPKKKKK